VIDLWLSVRLVVDELRGEDPEGTGLTTDYKLINSVYKQHRRTSVEQPCSMNFAYYVSLECPESENWLRKSHLCPSVRCSLLHA
jgi:hypothetical protein